VDTTLLSSPIQWSPITSDNAPSFINNRSKAFYSNGKLVVCNFTGSSSNAGWIYDLETDSWSQMSLTGAPPNMFPENIELVGSQLYAVGSEILGDIGGIYDIESDSWSTMSVEGTTNLTYSPLFAVKERLLAIGYGMPSPVEYNGIYDPKSDSWTPISMVGAPESDDPNKVAVGDKLILFGKDNFSSNLIGGVYNPDQDQWTQMSFDGAPNFDWSKTSLTAVPLESGLFLLGRNKDDFTELIAGFYSLESNSWSVISMNGLPEDLNSSSIHAVSIGKTIFLNRQNMQTQTIEGFIYKNSQDIWIPVPMDGALNISQSFSISIPVGYDLYLIGPDVSSGHTLGAYAHLTELIDQTPPLTTATPAGNIYNSPLGVMLDCADIGGSGCHRTYYTTDGEEPTFHSPTTGFGFIIIAQDTTLKFFSVDNVGNAEEVKTEEYIIDEEGPSVSIYAPQHESAVSSLYSIQGVSSDASSGVALVELQITDGGFWVAADQTFVPEETWISLEGTDTWSFNTSLVNWSEETSYTITARSTDQAGNSTTDTVDFLFGAQKSPSTINCSLSSGNIILGNPFEIEGQISPAPAASGAFVDLTFTPPTGPEIHRTVLANTIGEFRFDMADECDIITSSGTWLVTASWIGDPRLDGADSLTQTIEVAKAESRVTLDVTSQAIKIGEPVSISGKFTPQPDCGGGLAGIPITLVISGPGGAPDIKPITTSDPFGHFVLSGYSGFNDPDDWTVTASFAGNNGYLAATSDPISIKVVETAGYAIIVQGKHPNEEGLNSHHKTTDFVYKKLTERGLLHEDIYYLGHDITLPGEDGSVPVLNGAPSRAAIEYAITVWARDRMDPDFDNPDTPANDEVIGKPANLYIIAVDHGLDDLFFIDPETFSSTDLAGWIDTLQSSLSIQAADQEIITILGFCRSGSFIDELSGPHRVIITSAAAGESSYKGPLDSDGIRDGEYFISEFFKAASHGHSIRTCFEKATALTEQFTSRAEAISTNAPFYDGSRQHPMLDDNGDGSGTNNLAEGDGAFSENLIIGVSILTGNDPEDVTVIERSPTVFIDSGETTADLWARVDNNDRLTTIWAEVKPPGYDPIDERGSGQATMDLPRTIGLYDEDEERYEWLDLGGFVEPGTYQVFFFAKDDITGNVSPLVGTFVYKALQPNSAPHGVNLIEPADQAEVLTTVMLDWTDTTDPEGHRLSYTVLLSEGDDSFANPIRIENLINSTYLATPEDGIEDLATYYWKVQAIDEYGAASESAVRMFQTNNTNSGFTSWVSGHVYNTVTGALINGALLSFGGGYDIAAEIGGYYLGELPIGAYTVTVSASGYELTSEAGLALGSGDYVVREYGLMPLADATPGDVDSSGVVDLGDAITVFQLLSEISPSGNVDSDADVNDDGAIGLQDALYILQDLSGKR